MGLLRNFGKFALGSAFSFFLALLLIFSSFSQFTEYSNLKKTFSEFLSEAQIEKINITEAYPLIKTACKIKEKISLPVNNDTIEINCSQLEKIEEKDFPDFITTKIFEKFYFKEYACDVIECLRKGDTKNSLIVFSKEGNLFFRKIQNYLIFLTTATCVGFILILESWQERAKGLGKVLLSTGVLYFILKFGYRFFLPTQIMKIKIVEEIFSAFIQNFLYVFIAGIFLLIFGYLLSYQKKFKMKAAQK